jgi:hypothetical protein
LGGHRGNGAERQSQAEHQAHQSLHLGILF